MNNILIELDAVKQEVWMPAYQRLVWLFALLMSPTNCIPNKELHELRWILLPINFKKGAEIKFMYYISSLSVNVLLISCTGDYITERFLGWF